MKLEEIVNRLENIEEKVKGCNQRELKILEQELQRNWKFLYGEFHYLQKQKSVNIYEIKTLLKQVKKALKTIQNEKNSRRNNAELNNPNGLKVTKIEVDLELQEIQQIMDGSIATSEKRKKLEEKIEEYKATIEVYSEENVFLQTLKRRKKDSKTKTKNLSLNNDQIKRKKQKKSKLSELDQRIKENKIEIFRYKEYIGICKWHLIGLKETKIEYQHQKHEMIKVEKENPYYFLILKELLEEENDYNLVQELMKRNSKFLSVYNESFSSLFEEMERESMEQEKADILSLDVLQKFLLQTKYQKNRVNLIDESSKNIGEIFTFENQKYAFHYTQDVKGNTYLNIHVLDTSFLPTESNWYQKMKSLEKEAQREWKLAIKEITKDGMYPTFTYQLKVAPNGKIMDFGMQESFIKVDHKVSYEEFKNYRENDVLKNFIGTIKKIVNSTNSEEFSLSVATIEQIVDSILNQELTNYIQKNHLPVLYSNKVDSTEKLESMHSRIVYYLGKIPKEEAHDFVNLMYEYNAQSFYTLIPREESEIILDTHTWVGYNQLCVLKAFINGFLTDAISKKYAFIFEEYKKKRNGEEEKTDTILERKKEI